ncbi:MAG: 4Fe-4S binding protein [Deltaproteobacteria bacterium]|jgi:Fe-S-cluster-containing hydrogenase component 2|nr:4Fe-4S binding protein [Deltaproteobacteria bacterium]MCW8891845.1 4Fe-4S binding protein [Deltaproteobacteria bacterium]
MRIIIDQDLCCGSAECIKVCPEKAISLVAGKAVLDDTKCDFGGLCLPACPKGAIDYAEDEYSDYVGGCGF